MVFCLSTKGAKPKFWQQKAEEIPIQQPEKKKLTDQQLLDYLYTLNNIKLDVLKQNSVQKKLIADLKRSTKS